jgi:hypothetical protein
LVISKNSLGTLASCSPSLRSCVLPGFTSILTFAWNHLVGRFWLILTHSNYCVLLLNLITRLCLVSAVPPATIREVPLDIRVFCLRWHTRARFTLAGEATYTREARKLRFGTSSNKLESERINRNHSIKRFSRVN